MVNMKYDNQISFHMDALIRPDMQQWLMEHFINVSMDLEGFGNFIFIDNYIDDSYKLFYDEYSMHSYEEIREKADSYFIEQLVRGAYIFINIDRYYISVNEYTEKQHFVHPILLVGLSKDHTICHCIDFSPSKGRVYLDIPYPELLTSFHKSVEYYQYGSGAGILEECVVSFILKSAFRHGQSNRNHTHYDFRLNRFAAEIHDYITGNVRSGLHPDIYPKNDSHTYYGIKVYDIVYTLYKRSLTENPRMAFKTVYDLALHKKILQERLQYIQQMYMLSDTALKAIQKYDVVVQKTEALRLLNMKCNIQEKRQVNSLSFHPIFAEKFLKGLREIRDMEYLILNTLYNEICGYVPKKTEQFIPVKSSVKSDYKLNGIYYGITIDLETPCVIHKIDITYNGNSLPSRAEVMINDNIYPLDPFDIKDGKTTILLTPVCKTSQIQYQSDVIADNVMILPYTNPSNLYVDFNKSHLLQMDLDSDLDIERSFKATIHGQDPFIWTEVPFSADELKYIYLRYRTDCLSQSADIYFRDLQDENGSRKFSIVPSDTI